MTGWTTDDAEATYAVRTWGDGFFFVNEAGHVAVRPQDDSDLAVDVMDVIAEARRQDMTLPLIIRFQDVLRTRVRRLNMAFRQAIAEAVTRNADNAPKGEKQPSTVAWLRSPVGVLGGPK